MEKVLGSSQPKPSLDTVLKYAERRIKLFVNKFGSHFPHEHQEEMAQVARLRVFQAYDDLEGDKGWRTFVQTHCRGAILDYIRGGEGFQEVNKIPKTEKNHGVLRRRVKMMDANGEEYSLGDVLGILGIYEEHKPKKVLDINWDLVARMARNDADIHLVAKLCLGFTQTELSSMFMVSRERLTQRLQNFCWKLDAPEYISSNWIAQTIYAFGLAEHFSQPDVDLGYGWEYDPVDLYSRDINYVYDLEPQMYFKFDCHN